MFSIWVISVLLVIGLSLSPRLELPYNFNFADKLTHMLAYLWLGVLPFFSFHVDRPAVLAALSMVPLGILLEFGQQYIPGRCLSVGDMVANASGVLMGIWMGKWIKRYRIKRA